MNLCRDDGWPLCPVCEEDELWCPGSPELSLAGAPLSEWLRHEMRCYRCLTVFPPGRFEVAQA